MNRIATRQQWLAARLDLLAEEKQLQAARDRLAEKRRQMPWLKIETDYVFDSEGGPVPFRQLFDGRSQLLVYHFMYRPDWEEGCKSCSFWADGYNGVVEHLNARDVSLVAVSRAPVDKLLAYRNRMGWSFPWFSAAGNSFNYDFDVSFTPEQIESGDAEYNYRKLEIGLEELPGLSAFKKDADGNVFHTYSTYSRGLDAFNTAYQLLDLAPDGRNEGDLPNPMDWVRRHDEYAA